MSFSRDIFSETGPIAGTLAGYEIRPGQIRMSEKIEEAIDLSRNLIVEAGPGIGKSLAYLVPFINWAYRENKKVVVSTYTKTLQSQLYIKDLPFLKKIIGIDFRYVLCMGSENYVCLRKADELSEHPHFFTKNKKKQVSKIMEWLETTETGLAQDMDFIPDRNVWEKFSREYRTCRNRKCGYYHDCFYQKMREDALKAHILVVNHSLLFTGMISGGKVLPEFDALVLDEAHTLEDAATTHFTKNFTNAAIQRLIFEALEIVSVEKPETGGIKRFVKKLKSVSKLFFEETEKLFGRNEKTVSFDSGALSATKLTNAVKEMADFLDELNYNFNKSETSEEINLCLDKCRELTESIDFIFSRGDDKYVYWLDVGSRKTGVIYSFNAAPVNISGEMKKYLFDVICPIVLTSATLSMPSEASDFGFIKNSLGIDNALALVIDSPYDYANKVLMYLPKNTIDPNRDFGAFQKEVLKDVIDIYDIMGGRMFVLFTSFSMLNKIAEEIAAKRSDINILKQGEMPRYVLLDVFKKNRNAILMGTLTFWQGVDVVGSSLECVVITKLPFAVPSDPITAARIRSIQEDGRDAFSEYQVPKAVIMFKQGFGRLIRSHTDRGIVAILDSRVTTRHYGKTFLSALPKCKKTTNIQDIAEFFKS